MTEFTHLQNSRHWSAPWGHWHRLLDTPPPASWTCRPGSSPLALYLNKTCAWFYHMSTAFFFSFKHQVQLFWDKKRILPKFSSMAFKITSEPTPPRIQGVVVQICTKYLPTGFLNKNNTIHVSIKSNQQAWAAFKIIAASLATRS